MHNQTKTFQNRLALAFSIASVASAFRDDFIIISGERVPPTGIRGVAITDVKPAALIFLTCH